MAKYEARESTRTVRSNPVLSAGQHAWVTVVNPTNHRMLLQACDHCGVVKSENSVIRRCRAPASQSLVLGALSYGQQAVI